MITLLSSPATASQKAGRFYWTVNAFYRAISGDVFDEPSQWELLLGELWEKEPMNPPHASLLRAIARYFRAALEPRFLVMQESPLFISPESEPTPDVYLVQGREEDYTRRHPTAGEVLLLVEVADATVQRDTTEKALLYAQAGIADYWVSMVPNRELIVFRQPTPEGYSERLRLTEADTVRALAAPEVAFAVRDLVSRAPQPDETPAHDAR